MLLKQCDSYTLQLHFKAVNFCGKAALLRREKTGQSGQQQARPSKTGYR
jgi:hypothetical protein